MVADAPDAQVDALLAALGDAGAEALLAELGGMADPVQLSSRELKVRVAELARTKPALLAKIIQAWLNEDKRRGR